MQLRHTRGIESLCQACYEYERGRRISSTAQHALPRDRQLLQSDRPRSPDDGKRYLPQLRALDPMPVLGGVGVVSSILNGIMKLA